MQITINKITLIEGSGRTDLLIVETNLPSGVWPWEGNLSFKAEIASEHGLEYCVKNFPGQDITLIQYKDVIR